MSASVSGTGAMNWKGLPHNQQLDILRLMHLGQLPGGPVDVKRLLYTYLCGGGKGIRGEERGTGDRGH